MPTGAGPRPGSADALCDSRSNPDSMNLRAAFGVERIAAWLVTVAAAAAAVYVVMLALGLA